MTMTKLFATTATAALVASAIVPVASAAEFHDVKEVSDWATEAVEALVTDEILQGDDKGFFKPTGMVTRAAAAEILSKAKKLPVPTEGTVNFPDVNEKQWFYNSVLATTKAGIFEGNDKGQFNPNAELTREEAAAVIVRAFDLKGEGELTDFADADKVSNWAKESVEIAVANGVIKGDGTSINPKNSISRQEMAVMVHRVLVKQAEPEVVVENAPIVESVTFDSANKMVITFKEVIGSADAAKITVAGFEANVAKDLTDTDFTATVEENVLTLTAKEGVQFATGSEGNGPEGNLIAFAENAVVSKDSTVAMEAKVIAEGTPVEGKIADVTIIDEAAPVLLFATEVSNDTIAFTFSESVEVKGEEVAAQFKIGEVAGSTAVEDGSKLTVKFAADWKVADTVVEEVVVNYTTSETSYIADAEGNQFATSEIKDVQERELTELEKAVLAAETAVNALSTKSVALTDKIDAKSLTSEEASELFALSTTAQEKVNAVAALDADNEELADWNNAIKNVPFIAVATFVDENEATIVFTKSIDEAVTSNDIKTALKPVNVDGVEKNTTDYYFGNIDRVNGTMSLKKTSDADETRWDAGLVEGKVVITIDQESTFGQLIAQENIKF